MRNHVLAAITLSASILSIFGADAAVASETEAGLTLCNNSYENVSAALGMRQKGDWVSHGWLKVNRGQCMNIPFDLPSHVYLYGLGTRGSTWGNQYTFCTQYPEKFKIVGDTDCKVRGYDETGFFEVRVAEGQGHVTYTFSGGKQGKVESLDIGENVYVQGIFSDELATVMRIDRVNNRVKVRRSTDGTAVWLNSSQILSREQSVTNDLQRGAIGVALVVCILDPSACQ
jgi:uncharacterized membrane protein